MEERKDTYLVCLFGRGYRSYMIPIPKQKLMRRRDGEDGPGCERTFHDEVTKPNDCVQDECSINSNVPE